MPEEKTLKIPFQITVKDFAKKMGLDVAEVLKKLMENGIMTHLNALIDYETAFIIAQEFGFQPELDQIQTSKEEIDFDKLKEILSLENQNEKDLSPRPPVITILGHVDHGKTTLLDTLKKTHIADKEAGGITQHISAYQVEKKGQLITFVDTPGHEAFKEMRKRGALIADIVILVVAADDGVKPQTKEVIDFVLENKIPIIVAINKIDKPEANVAKVKQELAEHQIFLEGYGGEIPFCEISAKNNLGLDNLLDNILLLAELKNFKVNNKRNALGIVLESQKDSRRGILTTVLIKTGTLKIGQDVLVGNISGKIKRIEDYAGKSISSAPPSSPVSISGLEHIPHSHDILQVLDKELAKKRNLINNLSPSSDNRVKLSSKSLIKNIDDFNKTKFFIILKADTQGTLEALEQIIQTIPSDEIKAEIISHSTGSISESDIKKAQIAGCAVYGFGVAIESGAKSLAKNLSIPIKSFKIIYELVEDIKIEMSKLLSPEINEVELGKLKVLAVFKIAKNSTIAGGKVISGKMVKGENIKIFKGKEEIGKGVLSQLQHNKDDVSEVKEGLECGITFEGKGKIEVGDYLICFKEEKTLRKI